MDFSFDSYLKNALDNTCHRYKIEDFYNLDDSSLSALQSRVRADFIEALSIKNIHGIDNDDRKKPLSPTLLSDPVDMGGYTREKLCFTHCGGITFPLYLLRPSKDNDKGRAALFCHGHGIGAREAVGLDVDDGILSDCGYHRLAPVELCRLGYTVAVPELIGFGDTRLCYDKKRYPMGHSSCDIISANLTMMGTTLAGIRVYQAMRVVDYLTSIPTIDSDNLVCMGISGGGMLTAFLSAIDTRVKTAVVSGYLSTFRDSVLAMEHCSCNFVPGMYNLFEMEVLAALIFPRTLVIESGTLDPIFPVNAVVSTTDKVVDLYSSYGISDRFKLEIFKGDHRISGITAYKTLLIG